MCLFFLLFFWWLMKFLLFTLLLLTTFQSFAVVTIYSGGSNCAMVPDIRQPLIGTIYATSADAKAAIENTNWASTTCDWQPFTYLNFKSDSVAITYRNDGRTNIRSLYFRGTNGCDFNECKSIATQSCSANGSTLNVASYVWRSSGDYDASCNEPPVEPIQDAEECQSLSNNQCNTRGGASEYNFIDNNDFTYECTFTCGDGTTGDENGSLANEPDGLCDPNNPNDLADCDVADNTDPNCVIGCGDAYTPDPTSDIDYNSDGTTVSDGTGTDGITTTQGDVLINEIKNNNAEQIIKGSNKVADKIEEIDPNEKLSELITAVRENKPLPDGGSGTEFNDTNIVNSINRLDTAVRDSSDNVVNAIQDNSIENIVAISGNYDASNVHNLLSSTAALEIKVAERETILKNNIAGYKADLTSQLSFLTPSSSGYTTNNLQLSQGSFDVSWSRFSQYFSTIGTIVYALSALIALSILFMGRI
jgi:hypothetical protein